MEKITKTIQVKTYNFYFLCLDTGIGEFLVIK